MPLGRLICQVNKAPEHLPVIGVLISPSCLTKMVEQLQLNNLFKENQELLARVESLQRMAHNFKVLQQDVEGLKKATSNKTYSRADASSCSSSSSSDDNCSYPPWKRSRRRKHRSRHGP